MRRSIGDRSRVRHFRRVPKVWPPCGHLPPSAFASLAACAKIPHGYLVSVKPTRGLEPRTPSLRVFEPRTPSLRVLWRAPRFEDDNGVTSPDGMRSVGGRMIPPRIRRGASSRELVAAARTRVGREIHPARVPSARFAASSAKCSCTNAIAMLPSPTPDATRLMLPCRTSPAAKIPGTLVSSR